VFDQKSTSVLVNISPKYNMLNIFVLPYRKVSTLRQ